MTRVFFSIYAGLVLFALAIDLLVLLPLRGVGTLEGFYGPLSANRVSNIVGLVSLWLLMSIGGMIAVTVRLGSRTTWRWNYPNSWWRATRSATLITGLICLGAVIPGYIVGSPPVAGDSVAVTERTWELWSEVLIVGVFSLLAAALMYVFGAAVRVVQAVVGKKRVTVTSTESVN